MIALKKNLKSYTFWARCILCVGILYLSGCALLRGNQVNIVADGWYRTPGLNTLDEHTKSYIMLESNVMWIVDVTDWKEIRGFVTGHYQVTQNNRINLHLLYVPQEQSLLIGKVCSRGIQWHNEFLDNMSKRVDNPLPEGIFPRVNLAMPMNIWSLYGVTNEAEMVADSLHVPSLMKRKN